MLQGLRARTLPAHARLLLEVAARSPALAASFLASCTWTVEPQPSVYWCAPAARIWLRRIRGNLQAAVRLPALLSVELVMSGQLRIQLELQRNEVLRKKKFDEVRCIPLRPSLPSPRWTGATLVGQLAAAVAPLQAVRLALVEAAEGGCPPPTFDGAAVRTALRCALPPPLSKVGGSPSPYA